MFLKYTQKGLLKNVQDGISRPLGSRGIQGTKVATVLRDTLYNHNSHINHRNIDVITGCVPSFNISIIEQEIRS